MRQETRHPRIISRQQLLVAAVSACFTAGAHALPTVPTVVNGTAGFAQSGNVLTVTNSAGAIINWQKFGIAAGETTRFIQPSASSAVLNQVVGVNGIREMSQIHGTLSSNGKVWLINPAGILVGASGVIDTAGFIASTLTVRAEDFLAGKLNFQATPGAGDVVNRGTITTPTGGSVYLVGTNVSNEAGGVITTPGGETVLAAGAAVNLLDTSTPGVKVEITGAANNATNLGSIFAEAGRIGIAGTIVRNSGTLDASSVVNEGGRIFLKASQDTYVDGAGRIVATGTQGGQVEVLGNRVAVMDQASIDVSGTNGGGTIKVGGDYQGKNPDIQNAQITFFGPDATLKANATEVGDGGTVIVWADDTTRAYGHIEARGDANGGNGGFVETSGHQHLDVNGIRVDTGGGNWLLDPTDITISGSAATAGGSFDGDWYSSADSSTIAVSDLITNLGYGDLTISSTSGYSGSGNITMASDAAIQSTSTFQLNILAYNDLTIQSGSSINIGGSLYMRAGYNNFGTAPTYRTGSLTAGNITANEINLYAGNSININGPLTSTGSGTHMLAGWFGDGTLNISGNISGLTNVELDNQRGSISQMAGTISAQTGYVRFNNNYISTPAGSHISVNYIVSNGTSTEISSKGHILDNNGTATNITSDNPITLTSADGAPNASTLAISTDTAGTFTSLSATAGGTFGEIDIRHQGNAPGTIALTSNAFEESSVTFEATGDIILTSGSRSFTTNGCGIYLLAGGNLTTGTATFGGNPDEIGLYAADTLTIGQAINTTGWLGAGTAININQPLTAPTNDIGIAAGISMSTARTLADNDSELTLSDFMKLPTTSAGNININSTVTATNGDVGLLAGGNITLNEGSTVIAGNDVLLELRGATSKLDINPTAGTSGAYIWAKAPSTIYLTFTNLPSGGIFINGMPSMISSGYNGLFFGPGFSPASPGYGLILTYGAASSTLTNTITNTVIESTSEDPTIYDELPTVENIANADFLVTDETIGGGDEEFGEGQTEEDPLTLRKKKYAQCMG